MKAGFAALLACAVLTSCAPEAQLPRPAGTREPAIIESSSGPTAHPESSKACNLLTSEEREDLVRMSMDAEVAVRPVAGTEECIWTHSLTEPARSAIRVLAVNGQAWARVAREPIIRAINHPSSDRALDLKLQKALVDVSTNPEDLTDERVCEIYLLFTETRGLQRSDDLLFTGTIGSIPAVYAASCGTGYIVLAGFGEYGIRGSIAINHAVFRLVDAASERVDEVFDDSGNGEAGQVGQADEADEADETDSAADEDASPSPEPPTAADESDSEDEDES
jgi:hypothetical protein